MCGVVGFWDFDRRISSGETHHLLQRMVGEIAHRGPDGCGYWYDNESGLCFGHSRLAVVDLSQTGSQPMRSNCDSCVIAYNGEIYNTDEIRDQLGPNAQQLRGTSDTEVLLEACAKWGVPKAAGLMNGMFSFALWDGRDRCLWLVRDRLGIKPLYWGLVNGTLFFGSQPKSFFHHPCWRAELDVQAVDEYFYSGYVSSPRSIFKGVRKLEPGHLLSIDSAGKIGRHCYWSLESVARTSDRGCASVPDLNAELEELIADSVKKRMVADVPVGVFLSGGIDSSLVTALARDNAGADAYVNSYTVGFEEREFDEASQAAAVAKHLGTNHRVATITGADAAGIIERVPEIFDEPFADSSQLSTMLVSRLAASEVTVCLSGDGGDELFAGYNRYLGGLRTWENLRRISPPARKLLATGLNIMTPPAWEVLASLLPARTRPRHMAEKVGKLSRLLNSGSLSDYYLQLIGMWPSCSRFPAHRRDELHKLFTENLEPIELLQVADTLGYLPNDILTKVDRSSMGYGLEARVPLLDHRIVEHAWRFPVEAKVRASQGKWPLRQILAKYVPEKLTNRPKSGFAVPVGAWLRTCLKEWAETLMSKADLEDSGVPDVDVVRQLWVQHQRRSADHSHVLWLILMYQSWYRHWFGSANVRAA